MSDESNHPGAARILICEDEPLVAEDLAETLRDLGYEVAAMVLTGQEAIRMAGETIPDLILMDIRLKGEIDGIQTADRIRSRLDIPVVYLTGYAEKDILERAKRTEPYGFLTKPVGMLELKGTVETALYKHEADRRVRESEKRYDALVGCMAEGVILQDSQHGILSYNASAERILGARAEEVVGRFPFDIMRNCITEDGSSYPVDEHPSTITLRTGKSLSNVVMGLPEGKGEPVWISMNTRPLMRDGQCLPHAVVISFSDITERKRAEEAIRTAQDKLEQQVADRTQELVAMNEALRQSQSTLRLITDSLPVLITYVDSEQRYRFCNKTYETWRGVPREQIEGRHIEEVLGAAAYEDARQHVEAALSGIPVDYEMSASYEDGKDRRLDVIYVPDLDEKGAAEGFVALIMDITERKRTEEMLRESEEKLQAVFEASPAAIFIVNPEGHITLANRRMGDLFSRQCEELPGTPYLELVHPEERSLACGKMKLLMVGEIDQVSHERRYLAADGREFLGHLSGRRLFRPDNGLDGLVGIIEDITERRRVEHALRESEERYRNLVQTSKAAIFISSIDGCLIHANPRMAEMTGYDGVEDLIGVSAERLYTDSWDRKRLLKELQEKGSVQNFEVCAAKKDGTPHWISLNAVLQRDEAGNAREIHGIAEDVTDRKRVQEEVREAKDLAEMANRAKSEFLANMSHELRTPLNSIIGFSEILEDQFFGSLNEAQRSYVRYIAESGHHLLQLVTEVLDLSKIESGGMRLNLSQVNVRDVLENSLDIMRERTLHHCLAMESRVVPEIDGMTLLADELKLRQVIFNLLSNAIKFTPERGNIRVEAETTEEELIISVSDSGSGIDPSDTSRIFKAFEQVESTLGRQHQGTGLGLALARKLIEMHGGRIWVESEGRGKGSTFRFAIPLKDCQ